MEGHMNAAMAYYRSMQPNQQALAHDFFKALDTDGSGTVSLSEFLEFLRVVGLVNNRNGTVLFSLFDRDGNGTLDFFEVVALFHFLTIGAGAQLQQSAARSGDLRRLCDEKGRWNGAFVALKALLVLCNVRVCAAEVAACSIM